MFGGEVVERQQLLTVLLQAVAGFVVLRAVGFQEDVEGFDRGQWQSLIVANRRLVMLLCLIELAL